MSHMPREDSSTRYIALERGESKIKWRLSTGRATCNWRLAVGTLRETRWKTSLRTIAPLEHYEADRKKNALLMMTAVVEHRI